MRTLCFVLALGLAGLLAQPCLADGKDSSPVDPARIEKLIKMLGSSRFVDRDRARRELEEIGLPALEALRKAAKSDDLETSRRAADLVAKLEEKIQTTNLLAPKKVHLQLKDATVQQALDELSRQSGYPIQLQGDLTQVNGKKLNLDTGEITFWQAFDQVCELAGLVQINTPQYDVDPGRPRPIRPNPVRPPIRIRPLPAPVPAPGILPIPNNGGLPGGIQGLQKAQIETLKKLAEALKNRQMPVPLPEGQQELQKKLEKILEDLQKDLQQLPGIELPPLPPVPGRPEKAPAEEKAPAQKNLRDVQIEDGFLVAQVEGAQVQPGRVQVQGGKAVQGPAQGGQGVPGAPGAAGGQPGQAVVQPAIGRPVILPAQAGTNRIVVQPGTFKKVPTFYAGSVRVRLLPANSTNKGEAAFTLEVTPEPSLQNFTLIGTPSIHRAVDEMGQQLTLVANTPAPQGPNASDIAEVPVVFPGRLNQIQVPLRLKKGEKEAKLFKELSGTVTAQMLTPSERLLEIKDIMNAAGKSAKGKNGGELTVVKVGQDANGNVRIQVRIEGNLGGNALPGGIRIQPGAQIQIQQIQIGGFGGLVGVGNEGVPILVDAKGLPFELVQIPQRGIRAINGAVSQEVTLVYRANPGQGEPAALIVTGQRTTSVQIPFRFENVQMP